ncbi:MAG: anthranilate 1,2-dioxygenase large subunit [Zoogloeaceae bacterium]|nr:anthranilate 1,2-dioxygenase large subunit [Zoogloeaceae bacterium]
MKYRKTLADWKAFVTDALDFRPEDKVYRVAREIFTDKALFDLEMELIFERQWIYACHESELPGKHDYVTVQIGRQPLIITRDGDGTLNALVNACEHRGTTLTRVRKGNQAVFSCPFHAWCYRSNGDLVKVKADNEYGGCFDKKTKGLKHAKIESYKGFVFVKLNPVDDESLVDYLGDAARFLDMMVEQSETGELEVLPGISTYSFDGNWKLQDENGLDGYHVSTVHFNYVATVNQRQEINASKAIEAKAILDYNKLGAGDNQTDDGWFSFRNGHSVLFSDMPNAADVRPGYGRIMERLNRTHAPERARWTMHYLRNLNLYPSLFLMDQISSQIRIVRPVAWNKTEIVSMCLGVKGETAADRESRIRQFEDFFNVSGMGTPDDLVEFREAQRGFEARLEPWNDISRGCDRWASGETPNSRILGIAPVLTGTEITQEGLYVNQHQAWQKLMLDGIAQKEAQEIGQAQA